MLRYAVPLSLGAFLLFLVQPLVARTLLPWFGGTPSVWTTCMLFFQVLLVLGYGYAHVLVTRFEPSRQALIHTGLLGVSLAALVVMALAWEAPLVPSAAWEPQGSSLPILRILGLLTVVVGLPYFALATTSPLMQAWFSRTERGASPYRLYSLSNAGSLLGLLSYPFLIEPALAQKQQALGWSLAYALFALGGGLCAWRVWQAQPGAAGPPEEASPAEAAPPTTRDHLLWLALPALASMLLLAVTNHLCQDVAVTPFLWVVPLSLYLVTFIICFDHQRWYDRRVFLPALIVGAPLGLMLLLYVSKVHLPGQIAGYCGALFACCMVCHGELVALKPAPRHLTSFYLMVAVGGALGGVTVGLIAPLVFRGYTELPLALVLCFAAGILVPGLRDIRLPRPAQLAQHGAIGLVIGLSLIPTIKQRTKERGRIIAVVRNFYGLLRVREEHGGTKDSVRTLLHGWIIHGYQYQAAEWRRAPTSYYNEKSGVGLAVLNHPRRVAGVPGQSDLRIGVVGLGTGTMAVYGRAGDYVRFYEINPAVLRLSRSGLFTHLSDCPARVDVVLGDARLSLERELQQGSQQLDLLAMDAFSGDAVPAHLLTREAFELYLRHLRPPNGALVVHVSNRWLDLQPVVWKAAKHFNLDACLVSYDSDSDRFCSSYWMVLTTGRNYLRSLDVDDAAWSDTGKRHVRMWTDDFYNLFQIIK